MNAATNSAMSATTYSTGDDLVISVPDVSCGHCVTAISTSVGSLSGVTGVEVDLVAHRVRVSGGASRDDVVAAIEDAGYDVTD